MRGWFGPTWNAPVCRTTPQFPTPEVPCAICDKPFGPFDQGLVLPYLGEPGEPETLNYHHACLMACLGLGVVIHHLQSGYAPCRFSSELPGRWPTNHKWARDWEDVTCPGCLAHREVKVGTDVR